MIFTPHKKLMNVKQVNAYKVDGQLFDSEDHFKTHCMMETQRAVKKTTSSPLIHRLIKRFMVLYSHNDMYRFFYNYRYQIRAVIDEIERKENAYLKKTYGLTLKDVNEDRFDSEGITASEYIKHLHTEAMNDNDYYPSWR